MILDLWNRLVTRRLASPVARAVADLFENDPSGWSDKRFKASYRDSDLKVWIANKAYGLHLECKEGAGDWDVGAMGNASQTLVWRAFSKWRRSNSCAAESALIGRLAEYSRKAAQ